MAKRRWSPRITDDSNEFAAWKEKRRATIWDAQRKFVRLSFAQPQEEGEKNNLKVFWSFCVSVGRRRHFAPAVVNLSKVIPNRNLTSSSCLHCDRPQNVAECFTLVCHLIPSSSSPSSFLSLEKCGKALSARPTIHNALSFNRPYFLWQNEEREEFQTLLQFSFISWFGLDSWEIIVNGGGGEKTIHKSEESSDCDFINWKRSQYKTANDSPLAFFVHAQVAANAKKKNREKGNSSCFAIYPHLSSIRRGPKDNKETQALKWPAHTNLICPQSVWCVCVSFGLGWPQRPLLLVLLIQSKSVKDTLHPFKSKKKGSKIWISIRARNLPRRLVVSGAQFKFLHSIFSISRITNPRHYRFQISQQKKTFLCLELVSHARGLSDILMSTENRLIRRQGTHFFLCVLVG